MWELCPYPSPAAMVYVSLPSQMLIGVSHIEPYGFASGHSIVIDWREKMEEEKLKL